MKYRIYTNHGLVDLAFDLETAGKKFRKYEKEMHEGYSYTVRLVEVDRKGKERLITVARAY